MGLNVGFEQDGKGQDYLRPVVIIKKFNNEVMWAVPLTKNSKKNKYYFTFMFNGKGPSSAILSQMRLIDSKRLKYKIGDISQVDLSLLKQKIRQLLA
jgi:mRNA interferase MazF